MSIPDRVEDVLSKVWRSYAPSKVVSLSWQLFLNRDPTRDNVLSRGVIQDLAKTTFPLSGDLQESVIHLFSRCFFSSGICYALVS